MDMPATQRGVDLYPDRQPSVDFREYSARVREFGVALKPGDRIMVTTVRVKKKNIEFQLGGGGYGVFGDDTGYVYVPEESKSRREKDLEKWIKDERDYDRRRRMQRELDDLRRDRERENRRARSESRELTAQKESEIASKRLDAGSRFNLWFEEFRLAVARADAARDAADAVAVRRLRTTGRARAPTCVPRRVGPAHASAAAASAAAARRPRRVSASCAAACRWTKCTTCSASRPATSAGKQGELTTRHRVVRRRRPRHRGRLRRQRDRPVLDRLEVEERRPPGCHPGRLR